MMVKITVEFQDDDENCEGESLTISIGSSASPFSSIMSDMWSRCYGRIARPKQQLLRMIIDCLNDFVDDERFDELRKTTLATMAVMTHPK